MQVDEYANEDAVWPLSANILDPVAVARNMRVCPSLNFNCQSRNETKVDVIVDVITTFHVQLHHTCLFCTDHNSVVHT
jgi:hypothetical protein